MILWEREFTQVYVAMKNVEDNEYLEGVDPSLEFLITSWDIIVTGATTTLLIFNNEKGFTPKNMESICNVGYSTKACNSKSGYIGEKGSLFNLMNCNVFPNHLEHIYMEVLLKEESSKSGLECEMWQKT